MTELTFRKGARRTRVSLYDDIEQMPIERFNKMNKYWMLSDSIGSDIGDFDKKHYGKMQILVDDREKMLKQLENFRILVYNVQNEVNVDQLSFACMVYSINDEVVSDMSEANLKRVLKRLSDLGLTQDVLKKKLNPQESQSTKSWKNVFRMSSG